MTEVQTSLGETLQTLGKYDQAEPLLRRTLEIQQRIYPKGDEQVLFTMSSLVACVRAQDRLPEAEALTRNFLELARRAHGPAHPATMSAMNSLGVILLSRGQPSEALAVSEELLGIAQGSLPPGNYQLAVYHGNVGDCLAELGRDKEAEPHLIAAYEGLSNSIGEDRNLTERRLDRLYRFYYQTGRLEDADRMHRVAVRLRLRVAGTGEFSSVLRSIDEYFEFAEMHGTFRGADDLYRDLIDYAHSLPADHPLRPQYLGNLGRALAQKERFDLAEPLLLASLAARKESPRKEDADVHALLEALIDLYAKTDRHEKASELQTTLADARRAAD